MGSRGGRHFDALGNAGGWEEAIYLETTRGGHRVGAGRGGVARTTEAVAMTMVTSPDALRAIRARSVDADHDACQAVANVN